MKLSEMRETRAAKIAEMRALNDKNDGQLSGEDKTKWDGLKTEVDDLNVRMSTAETMAELERSVAGGEVVSGDAQRAQTLQGYSLAKAMGESRSGTVTGLEAEWHQELSAGRNEVRGVMVPTEIILGGEQRALTTTTPGAGPGSNLVATDLAAMTDRRRPMLKIERLGATILRGLTGNLDLPRLVGSGSAGWVSEHTNATRTDASFAKKTMGPKTVAAEYEVSRQMLNQSNQAVEPILRGDLAYLVIQKMDGAAINGGGANEPTGILSDPEVQSVPFAGLPLLGDTAADLIAALELDDVTGTRAFLTNPNVLAVARKLRDDDKRFMSIAETFHNERVEATTQVPNDLGAGGDMSALIYGEWASLYLGYWSGVDLLMNPFHGDVASKGGALLHAFLDCDVVVRHPEAFRYTEVG